MAERATPLAQAHPLPPKHRARAACSPRAGAGEPAQLSEAFAGLVEPQALAGSVVELVSDAIEVSLGQLAQIGALGEVLAQQPVGVLVGTALPRRVRIAGVHLDTSVGAD